MNPRYPVYIISKGRADSHLTPRALDRMNVPYKIVVEPQEYDDYCKTIDSDKIMQAPFSNLGQGSIPVRNFVWEDSIKNGFARHWILDDNIEDFNRLNRNMKLRVRSGSMFAAAEDFTERYSNVAMSGLNYYNFCKSTEAKPPYTLNTRIYSCTLIRNDLEFRWRGIYNEDTDLSLRILKAGYATILFNAFLCGKVTTLRMKGGNTDELYAGDGRKKMAESLVEQHPDVASVVWKFNRWHHHVDYRPFKNNELNKKDVDIPDRINNYGMIIVDNKEKFI